MGIEAAGQIASHLIDDYSLNITKNERKLSSLVEDRSKFKDLLKGVRSIIESSQNRSAVSNIRNRLGILESELRGTKKQGEVSKISKIIELADKVLSGLGEGDLVVDEPCEELSLKVAATANSVESATSQPLPKIFKKEMQARLDLWVREANKGENREEVKEIITAFLKDPSERNLKFEQVKFTILPDIFSYSAFVNRLNSLEIVDNDKFVEFPESTGELSNLIHLNLRSCPELTKFPSSFGNLKNLAYLNFLGSFNLTHLPSSFEKLTSLKRLDVSYSPNLRELPDYIEKFEDLERLWARRSPNLAEIPESIGSLSSLKSLDISSTPKLTGLPISILDLSLDCDVSLEGCGLSQAVLDNLERLISVDEYQGPRFSYSMSHFNPAVDDTRTVSEHFTRLYILARKRKSYLKNLPKDSLQLRTWLSRLSYMADYNAGGERQYALAKSIVDYIEEANKDSFFREVFLSVIDGAADTCGDRVALSVVNLGIAYQIHTSDLLDMQSLKTLLSRGVWAMKILEDVAREKVKKLPLVDEVEVYLGYPTMLKEALQLPINIEEMLYFRCSKITKKDLGIAKELVESCLSNLSSLSEFLVTESKWIEALELNHPQKMRELTQAKDEALEKSETNEQDIIVGEVYKQGVVELTANILV
jgi:hypothetical protein